MGFQSNSASRSCGLRRYLLPLLCPWLLSPWASGLTTTLAAAVWVGLSPPSQSSAVAQTLAIAPQTRRTVLIMRPTTGALSEQQISDRFAAAGLGYQTVTWSELEDIAAIPTAESAAAPILFLPPIDVVTPQQFQSLQQFLQQGGRLVVGGPIGLASSESQQQALRSLLGAYWAFPNMQPAPVQAAVAQVPDLDVALSGGVVVPHSPDSRVIATWQTDAARRYAPPAVVKTDSVMFLGWRWGEATDPQVDSAWLQAAVLQYDDQFATGGQRPTPAATDPAAATPPAAAPALSPASQIMANAAGAAAPGGIPIWPREANLMTQELKGLIGRFESALLLAESTAPVVGEQEDSVLVAAARQVPLGSRQEGWQQAAADTPTDDEASDSPAAQTVAQSYSILNQAQQALEQFPLLVAQRDYEAARRTWFEARRQLWDNFPSDRPVVQPEIRAIWLDRGTIVNAGSHRALIQVFDQLAQAGINTVFFETVNAGYPIYPSRVAPEQNPLIKEGWDPLASAVELAHERNMELHAWVWAFAAGNQRHNTLVDQPWDYLGPVLARHPQWANLDHRGNPIPQGQTKPFFDPANPEARRYLLRLYNEILTRYEVDGLQLDYIRYPFQDPSAGRSYGYGVASRRRFKAQTGVDPVTISPRDRELWEQWTDFRITQIDSFVAAVSDLVRRRRPESVLSAAVFPMQEHDRRHKIQQLWERWARSGEVDIIATMSYAIDTPQLETLVNPWLNESLAPALVLPAIRLLNLPNTLALDQIQALRDLPAGGYALFAAENLHKNAALQQLFQRTQGGGTAIPYREPFTAAAERYTLLQREWDVALSSGRLYISDRQEAELVEQAIALGDELQALVEDPSPQSARQAKRHLNRFRREFGQWMTLQSINGRYRVRTWENRLTAIGNLIAYGEERLER